VGVHWYFVADVDTFTTLAEPDLSLPVEKVPEPSGILDRRVPVGIARSAVPHIEIETNPVQPVLAGPIPSQGNETRWARYIYAFGIPRLAPRLEDDRRRICEPPIGQPGEGVLVAEIHYKSPKGQTRKVGKAHHTNPAARQPGFCDVPGNVG